MAKFLTGLSAKQAWVASFIAGAVFTLGFAPFSVWATAFIALPLCYLLLDTATSRAAALTRAFFFGYGFNMAGTWWIANALLVDAAQFGWLVPLCVLGLTGLYALWFVLFGWLVWHARTGDPLKDVVRFAVAWVIVEYLHSMGMFGFPWNLAGYIALNSLRLSQLASIFGVYGLSLCVVLLALLPVLFFRPLPQQARGMAGVVALLFVIAAYAYGMWRVPAYPLVSGTRVRVVQANIPQEIKWANEGRMDALRMHATMSQIRTDNETPHIIIWPESAFTFTLYPDSSWPEKLAEVLPPGGVLITGATRGEDAGGKLSLWNSIVAIDRKGKLLAAYDKHRLVPFGEFVPLSHLLPMNKITPGALDFSRGSGPRTLEVADVPPFSPLVCYEAIFPGLAVDPEVRPQWLLNVTNDAWYGDSPGPYQHFAMSRVRAIEQGLPLVRAANTGISAVIDPYGRILRQLALNERGLIDQSLPSPAAPPWYAVGGNWITALLLALIWSATISIKSLRLLVGKW